MPDSAPSARFAPPAVEVRRLGLTVPVRGGGVNAGGADLTILDDISFSVPQNQVAAITGPSGSGKTSLLMLLAGLERPTRGAVAIDGQDLGAMGENALAAFRRSQVGIVFQSFHLLPTMTALENVLIPLELAGVADGMPRARAALEAVGLGARLEHRPSELSGGEQQRVALARAFVARPRLLLADEPTGNLDPKTGEGVIDLMFDLRSRFGTTLVLITHDRGLAARCDRRIDLAAGRIVADGQPA